MPVLPLRTPMSSSKCSNCYGPTLLGAPWSLYAKVNIRIKVPGLLESSRRGH